MNGQSCVSCSRNDDKGQAKTKMSGANPEAMNRTRIGSRTLEPSVTLFAVESDNGHTIMNAYQQQHDFVLEKGPINAAIMCGNFSLATCGGIHQQGQVMIAQMDHDSVAASMADEEQFRQCVAVRRMWSRGILRSALSKVSNVSANL